MRIAVVSVVLLLAATSLPAQNYYRAIQQAQRDAAQNTAEQQRISHEAGAGSSGGSATAPAAPAPVDPALQATLNNISGLQTDFAGYVKSTEDKVDPAQKVSLRNDLTQAGQGTNKASADSIKKLADDLASAMLGQKKLTAAEQTKLAREIHALFNSSHLTAATQDKLMADIQKTLTDAGVSGDNTVNVMSDLKDIASQTK